MLFVLIKIMKASYKFGKAAEEKFLRVILLTRIKKII